HGWTASLAQHLARHCPVLFVQSVPDDAGDAVLSAIEELPVREALVEPLLVRVQQSPVGTPPGAPRARWLARALLRQGPKAVERVLPQLFAADARGALLQDTLRGLGSAGESALPALQQFAQLHPEHAAAVSALAARLGPRGLSYALGALAGD